MTFAGFRQGEALLECFAAADVFVLLSRRETWGVVVNEAAAFGLPLVLSDRVGAAGDLLRDGRERNARTERRRRRPGARVRRSSPTTRRAASGTAAGRSSSSSRGTTSPASRRSQRRSASRQRTVASASRRAAAARVAPPGHAEPGARERAAALAHRGRLVRMLGEPAHRGRRAPPGSSGGTTTPPPERSRIRAASPAAGARPAARPP